MKSWFAFAALIFLGLNSCDKKEDPLPLQQDVEIQAYLEANGLSDYFTPHDGYYYRLTEESNLPPKKDSVVSIYYSIRLLEGTEVIKHQADDGDPIRFKKLSGSVFPVGLDSGVELMFEGETYEFIFPSYLAYDTLSIGTVVPEQSIIFMEVELVRVESEEDIAAKERLAIESYINDNEFNDHPDSLIYIFSDNGSSKNELVVYKTQINSSGIPVNEGDRVEITWSYDFLEGGSSNENGTLEFVVGAGLVIRGLEEAVLEMRQGEEATILISSKYAYRQSVTVIPGFLTNALFERGLIPEYGEKIPPYTPLVFKIDVISVD